jgi:hypothetical protein
MSILTAPEKTRRREHSGLGSPVIAAYLGRSHGPVSTAAPARPATTEVVP